jgi:hypothetical protein
VLHCDNLDFGPARAWSARLSAGGCAIGHFFLGPKVENLSDILALYKMDSYYQTELIPAVFEEKQDFSRPLKRLQSLGLFTPKAVVTR